MSEQTGAYVPQPGEIRWVALECVGPNDDDIGWITINEATGDIWQGIQADFDHLAHDDATLLPVPPPGYRIVPADAVVIDRATADTLSEALPRVIAFLCGYGHGRPQLAADIISMTDLVTALKAAAVALRGEG